MLNIEQLSDLSYVTDNIDEIYDTHKALTSALEQFKSTVKETGEWLVSTKYNIKISPTTTLEPIDMNAIMKAYPLEQHQNIYTIKLAKWAWDIITDPALLKEKTTLSVLFAKNS